jgi:hypothetical protein
MLIAMLVRTRCMAQAHEASLCSNFSRPASPSMGMRSMRYAHWCFCVILLRLAGVTGARRLAQTDPTAACQEVSSGQAIRAAANQSALTPANLCFGSSVRYVRARSRHVQAHGVEALRRGSYSKPRTPRVPLADVPRSATWGPRRFQYRGCHIPEKANAHLALSR